MSTDNYGNYYFCVKVPKTISQNGEIYLYADTVRTDQTGNLFFEREKDGEILPNVVFAAGKWILFFAASCLDGSAATVEHWKGEVDRGFDR
ncbi:MAG: hypothetical protein RBT11_17890 [Desulfobacterales bacterium]|jgi:hypothetical protein|nr:hypothetical protein [Desulfobacterales bacterium]